jgi:hypothetical protein
MITRQQIRDKINEILQDPEYKRHYYDGSGNINGAVASNGEISSTAIQNLLSGYFNDQLYVEAKTVTLVTVETASGKYYNEIPSAEDLEIATAQGFDTSQITDPTTPYDYNVHGVPTGEGIQTLTFSVSSSGDFFADLNTYALIAAAVYELVDERIQDIIGQLANQGINIT